MGVDGDSGSAAVGLLMNAPPDVGGVVGGLGERRAGGGRSEVSMSLPRSESSWRPRRSARSKSLLGCEFLRLRLRARLSVLGEMWPET